MTDKINIKDLEYPFNLLWAVTEDEEILENADTISDFKGSVEYALCTLTERERDIIIKRFVNKLTYKEAGDLYGVTRERIRQVEAKALRKLRHPQRSKYLINGISGIIENIKTDYHNKLNDLGIKLAELCKVNEKAADEIIEEQSALRKLYKADSIEQADFSVRTYNCLKRHGINTISELATLRYDEIVKIRNIGRKCVAEIIDKLKEYGYTVNYNEFGELKR